MSVERLVQATKELLGLEVFFRLDGGYRADDRCRFSGDRCDQETMQRIIDPSETCLAENKLFSQVKVFSRVQRDQKTIFIKVIVVSCTSQECRCRLIR